MKNIFSVLLVCPLLCFAKEKNDLSKLHLLGRIKSISFLAYVPVDKFGKTHLEIKGKLSYVFNKSGNVLKKTQYDQLNKLFYSVEYIYDAKGNNVEIIDYDANMKLTNKTINKYDEIGYKTEENNYSNNGDLEHKNTFSYGDSGKLIKITYFDPKGEEIGQSNYTYQWESNIEFEYIDGSHEGDGRYIKKEYDILGDLIQKTENNSQEHYDKNGNIIEKLEYLQHLSEIDQENSYKWHYEFDTNGNIIEGEKTAIRFDKVTPIEYLKTVIIYDEN